MRKLILLALILFSFIVFAEEKRKIVNYIQYEDGFVFCIKDKPEDTIAACFPVMNEQFNTCDITDPLRPDCTVQDV